MAKGYFGKFGGMFVPETLVSALRELELGFNSAKKSHSFQKELSLLNSQYAGRPTPISFAPNLSKLLGCRIFLKREDLLHTGAHKLNNALGQALLAKHLGKKRIIAETGAGQHGVAVAAACARLGLQACIYMGAKDIERQKPNVFRMKLLGAQVKPVTTGSQTLKDAVNECLRDWTASVETTHYLLGSALGPHPFPQIVAHFQSVIGREARKQFAKSPGGLPDYIVACVGGGSNAIGIFKSFFSCKPVRLVGVEAGGKGLSSGLHASRFCSPSPRKGVLHGTFTYLLSDKFGQIKETHSVSAGLDYPAVGPEHSFLKETGRVEYSTATDLQALRAFELLSRCEGIIPALESAHALAWVVANKKKLRGKKVLVNLSGRGDKDLFHAARLLGEKIEPL